MCARACVCVCGWVGCDVNKDGLLTMAKIRAAPQCASSCISCVKHMAIIKFLSNAVVKKKDYGLLCHEMVC